jgi:hypothetical protein
MNLSPKIISVLSVVQVLFIVGGYLFTRSCLKLYDIILSAGIPDRVPKLALFVRANGLYFLLVPLVWACAATIRGRAVRGIAFISVWQFITGSVLTAVIVVFFLLGTYQALESLH